jgi:hypothetical protein
MEARPMRIERETYEAIQEHAGSLQAPAGLDPALLLLSLSVVESSGGFNNQRRVEPAYLPGGRYCNQALYDQYGDDAAASWGPLQVMYVTAKELGYPGAPQDLGLPSENIPVAIKLINRRIVGRGATTLEQIADAYNSGFKDQIIPQEYIRQVKAAYGELAAHAPDVETITS